MFVRWIWHITLVYWNRYNYKVLTAHYVKLYILSFTIIIRGLGCTVWKKYCFVTPTYSLRHFVYFPVKVGHSISGLRLGMMLCFVVKCVGSSAKVPSNRLLWLGSYSRSRWQKFFLDEFNESITLPNTITRIGESNFQDCKSLTEVNTFSLRSYYNW